MQRYRHPLGPSRACTAEGPPVDLYGLPALPPDDPVPQPAPAGSSQTRPHRSGARSVIVGLVLAAGVVAAAASAVAFFSGF